MLADVANYLTNWFRLNFRHFCSFGVGKSEVFERLSSAWQVLRARVNGYIFLAFRNTYEVETRALKCHSNADRTHPFRPRELKWRSSKCSSSCQKYYYLVNCFQIFSFWSPLPPGRFLYQCTFCVWFSLDSLTLAAFESVLSSGYFHQSRCLLHQSS